MSPDGLPVQAETYMKEDELEAWFRFIGYGDPNSWLWLVGIEEGGDVASGGPRGGLLDFKIEDETVKYDPGLPEEVDRNKVWRMAESLADSVGLSRDPPQYFLTNIAPLPRNNIDKRYAGLDPGEYRTRVIKERVGRLLRHRASHPHTAMIFHGAAGWRCYRVITEFGLSKQSGQDSVRGLIVFESERLIFSPTFSWGERHFKQTQKEAVQAHLRSWSPRESLNKGGGSN